MTYRYPTSYLARAISRVVTGVVTGVVAGVITGVITGVVTWVVAGVVAGVIAGVVAIIWVLGPLALLLLTLGIPDFVLAGGDGGWIGSSGSLGIPDVPINTWPVSCSKTLLKVVRLKDGSVNASQMGG